MIYTFETRLNIDAAMDTLLAANAAHWSFGLRKAWAVLYRQGLTKPQAYAELCKLGFTSHQVRSLLISVEMKQAALKEFKKAEIRQLKLAVLKREDAIWAKTRKADALSKRLLKLREKRDSSAPAAGRPRSKRYLKVLGQLRELEGELAFCRNWIAQKERVLRDKQGKLARAQKALTENRFALCFGSKKLLAQRPGAHNPESPFESLAAWRQAWDDARDHLWWSVGTTDKPQGNAEVQWLPESRQLRLRLTDRLAHERMAARGVPHSGGPQKVMPQRMACRFLVLDGVDFISHRGAARAALMSAFGQRPVTMRVLYRRQADGSRAWYVQASLDVPQTQERRSLTRESGVLGLDFNARGVAWCAVKPDGNRLSGQHGFFRWDLKSLPALERRQVIGTTVAQLVRHAQRLQLAVAIENLDFETKRVTARAGSVNKRYNDMLGSLPSSQFEQMMSRACAREHLLLYSVNPLYSSVGGFAKYGRANRMDADTSAALWIGRQALLGELDRVEPTRATVKHFKEQLVLSHLPATPMQSMTALAGAQWKDVAWGLGSNRKLWGTKLRRWFEHQVETASRPAPQGARQPTRAITPVG